LRIGILKKVRIFHNGGDVVKEIGGLRGKYKVTEL